MEAKDLVVVSISETQYDLLIAGGDLVIGPTAEQHQALLMSASPGHYILNPALGVDMGRFANNNGRFARNELEKRASEQLTADGATNVNVIIS
jgi:hypothetical protein